MSQELVSMAQQFSGLPMDDLIGGPLNAAARANSTMALTQTKFLLDTCFTSEEENYTPIMIKMSLSRAIINAENNEDQVKNFSTEFNLPLLTIIPLNSLAVDNVDVKFEMEVKSSYSENTKESKEKSKGGKASLEAKFKFGCFSAKVNGSVSYDQKESSSKDTHYQKSNNAKYSVGVHAAQIPLPQGVTTIIDVFSKAIEPILVEGNDKAKPQGK